MIEVRIIAEAEEIITLSTFISAILVKYFTFAARLEYASRLSQLLKQAGGRKPGQLFIAWGISLPEEIAEEIIFSLRQCSLNEKFKICPPDGELEGYTIIGEQALEFADEVLKKEGN